MTQEPNFTEVDLQRLMADQASRVECTAQLQRRYVAMQNLVAKIHSLSDSEFEAAYGTLESMIENYNAKKLQKEKRNKTSEANLQLNQSSSKLSP